MPNSKPWDRFLSVPHTHVRFLYPYDLLIFQHRISSIMKYDRVMVMENGEILEFDSPDELVKTKDGHFASLVNQSYK